MQNYLCENLKLLRKKNNLTQEKFAKILGIKRTTYANHEKQGVPTRYIPLYSEVLLKEFGVKISQLIDAPAENNEENTEDIIKSIELIERGLKEIKNVLKAKNPVI